MHITVIGAGVVGVTTAWALLNRGHDVTVVERLPDAALETSRGNAGQRSYGVVYPWASAAMVAKALPMLLKPDGALKMGIPPSFGALRFMFETLRFAYAPGLYGLNRRAMLRLAMHSKRAFLALENELPLAFDGAHEGLLQLASSAQTMADYRATYDLLREMDIPCRLLSSDQVREAEPGMTGDGPLHGAISYDSDGTGDCQLFTQALARECADRGVVFRFDTELMRLMADGHQVQGAELKSGEGRREQLNADAFILCGGCASPALLSGLGLRLPIYPVKGYSLTAPLLDPKRAPVSTVHDDNFKVVSTRLGQRLRATGFVELNDFNRDVPERRLETIRKSVASRFPGAADLDHATSWTGFRPMTPDGPPIIGQGPRQNLYLNTGHGTFGWTLSAGSANLIAQIVDGETPDLNLDAFRPGRYAE